MRVLFRNIFIHLFSLVALSNCLHAVERRTNTCANYVGEAPPQFRVARETRNDARHAITVSVSIARASVTQDKLVSLACELGRVYAKNQTVVAWIFDSYRAAKRYNPQGEGNDGVTNRALRATYVFSRADSVHELRWLPDPSDESQSIKFELGPVPDL